MIKILITGNGAGKTTCAIGKAIRFIGNKQSVYFRSFFKTPTSESSTLMGLEQCYPKLLNYQTCGVYGYENKNEQFKAGALELTNVCLLKDYNVIILDELTYMLEYLKWDKEYITKFINNLQCDCLIITGRNCPRWFVKIFDTVSEIKKMKHIYDETKEAHEGIDF